MSALYCTINDCAAKNKPTGRGHRSIAATVKDWTHSLQVRLSTPPRGYEADTLAEIVVKDLRTGQEFVLAEGELRQLFIEAQTRSTAR